MHYRVVLKNNIKIYVNINFNVNFNIFKDNSLVH